ncbi:MAG: glycosyltransferase [Spirosomataceae bacterium]
MKILQVVSGLSPKSGGIAEGIRNTFSELSKKEVTMEVISCDEQTEAVTWQDKFVHHALGQGKTSWRYTKDLAPFLRENIGKYNVVIINGLWQYPSYCTMKVIRELRKKGVQTPKVYVMPHGMLDPWFQRALSRRWKALRNEVYWTLVERQVVNEADGLLFTCQQELELARTTFWGYRPKQEINVGYGILPPPACTEEIIQAFQHPRPYFLFLSRIHEKKGVDILITAYQQLRKENPVGAIPDLVIAGPGLESVYGQKVQGLVQNEYKKYISFVGMLSGDRKWSALYGCEVFVLPSHQENFGIAVVEAMACGKPVLISDQVNIWKEITHSNRSIKRVGGLVAQPIQDEVYHLLDTFVHLKKDEKKEMGLAAQAIFSEYFLINKIVDNFIKLGY